MKSIYIAAGGTAGHINAAKALGEYFLKNNFDINYITGTRHLDYKLFKDEKTLYLDSKPLRSSNPVTLVKNIVKNLISFWLVLRLFIKTKPQFVIGCGGYVCGPSLVAAKIINIPVFILEQNAVMGLTNRLLSIISNKIFTNFKDTKNVLGYFKKKIVVVGNPVRSMIKAVEKNWSEEKIRIFVFGGSLGAKQINLAIEELANYHYPCLIEINHQIGKDYKFSKEIFSTPKFQYKYFEYIDNIQEQYNWCNIIVSRAGASTISELRIVQKPVIIIPFPQATDNHQYYNAKELSKEVKFPVSILDHNKNSKQLADEIYNQIIDWYRNRNVLNNETYQFVNDVPEKMHTEILKCLE